MKTLDIKFFDKSSRYQIAIGGSLDDAGSLVRKWLGDEVRRVLIVSNQKVFGLYGSAVEKSLGKCGFTTSTFLMPDGERYKSLRTVEKALSAFAVGGITRTDAVIALGGGVVGDLAGFAAALHLRGIRFIQIPTTLLAMIDSSVGGKTGVNSASGKNLIGAFHQPSGVLIEPTVLATLPRREVTAGMCEMVKHGALSGKKLLTETQAFITQFAISHRGNDRNPPNFKSEISNLIFQNLEFKAKIVAGDEREESARTDAKSRKILNFGHTLAHALEKVTGYRKLKHGEAVGYGILFAAELSKTLALCDQSDVELLNDVLRRVGPLPRLGQIDIDEVLAAFRSDKKHLAGWLQMVLLEGIGKPVIKSGSEISAASMRSVLTKLLRQWS